MKKKSDGTRGAKESVGSNARRRTLRRMRKLLATGAAVGVYACDGPVVADPLPPPPPTIIPADTAVIGVALLRAERLPAAGKRNLFGFRLRMEETGGSVGANIDFIRVDLLRAGGELQERQELGAGKVIRETGSNRLEANQVRTDDFVVEFGTDFRQQLMRITVAFTDDRGNKFNVPRTFVFS